MNFKKRINLHQSITTICRSHNVERFMQFMYFNILVGMFNSIHINHFGIKTQVHRKYSLLNNKYDELLLHDIRKFL